MASNLTTSTLGAVLLTPFLLQSSPPLALLFSYVSPSVMLSMMLTRPSLPVSSASRMMSSGTTLFTSSCMAVMPSSLPAILKSMSP